MSKRSTKNGKEGWGVRYEGQEGDRKSETGRGKETGKREEREEREGEKIEGQRA